MRRTTGPLARILRTEDRGLTLFWQGDMFLEFTRGALTTTWYYYFFQLVY